MSNFVQEEFDRLKGEYQSAGLFDFRDTSSLDVALTIGCEFDKTWYAEHKPDLSVSRIDPAKPFAFGNVCLVLNDGGRQRPVTMGQLKLEQKVLPSVNEAVASWAEDVLCGISNETTTMRSEGTSLLGW